MTKAAYGQDFIWAHVSRPIRIMQWEDTAAKAGSRKLIDTSMKQRWRSGVRHSQHPSQGLVSKPVAVKDSNSTPVEHFATSGDAFCSQMREGVKLAPSREETVPGWTVITVGKTEFVA